MQNILLFAMTIIATTSGFFFNTPNYVTFNTQYYNTTNCSSNVAFHNTSYEFFCYDDVTHCCSSILKETSYLPNKLFDVCYSENVDNNTILFLYHCEETNLNKKQSIMLTFFWVLEVVLKVFLLRPL